MKIEIDNSQLINDIAEKVVKQITPLLTQNKKNNDNELMTVSELASYLKVKHHGFMRRYISVRFHSIKQVSFHASEKSMLIYGY